MLNNILVGSWKLVSYEALSSDGKVSYPLGPDALGYIIYTQDGYMSVAMMSANRLGYASGDILDGTDEEKIASASSYVAYCGRYELQDDKVVHHVEVAFCPNRNNTSQERFIKICHDSLVLTTPPMLINGMVSIGRLVWVRVPNPDEPKTLSYEKK